MNIDPAKLSEGIRDLVVWLNEQDFVTTDSGDGSDPAYGSNHEQGMEGACPFPMVVISCDTVDDLITQAQRLHTLLHRRGVVFGPGPDDPRIEASYNPADESTVILLCNVLSKNLQ